MGSGCSVAINRRPSTKPLVWLATSTTGPASGRFAPFSISMLRKNTRTSRRANTVIDQSANRRSDLVGGLNVARGGPTSTRVTALFGAPRILDVGLVWCRSTQKPDLGSGGVQAQNPRCANGGSAMARITGTRAAGAALLLFSLTATGVLLAPAHGRGVVVVGDDVRHAAVALRQGERHRGHRPGGDQLHHQHRLRRRPRLLGQSRARPGDGGRRQGDDRLVQRPGWHQRAQDRGRLLRLRGDQRRHGHDPGLQDRLHAGRRGLRARRPGRADPA